MFTESRKSRGSRIIFLENSASLRTGSGLRKRKSMLESRAIPNAISDKLAENFHLKLSPTGSRIILADEIFRKVCGTRLRIESNFRLYSHTA